MTAQLYHLLNRITYGPRPEDRQHLAEIGWDNYVAEQLNPGEEPEALRRMIQEDVYGWRFDINGESTQMEMPLTYYDLSIGEIFRRLMPAPGNPAKYDLRRPFFETLIVSWLKALHSPWQLRELMVEFWHNHFTVSVDIEDGIAACYAAYDRETIRPNVLGNFRTLLEAVAQAPAMLHYLDNAVSRASPANENFARELFELHTMGAGSYYNHLYDEWTKVPGALEGRAEGYIDEDVYEAARAFTGWTVAINQPHRDLSVPDSGEFYYFDLWHDPYKKRVLGVELKSHQGPMEDGRQVLDLLAYHPRTAHFIVTKLCRWLVADDPPQSVVDQAVGTWIAHQRSPDQIKATLRTILLAPEFAVSLGQKLKRPNHLILAFVRMTGAQLTPHESVFWWTRKMGYHQFTCPFPTGNPDRAEFWINSDALLKRWQSFPELERIGAAEGFFDWDVLAETPAEIADFASLLEYWTARLIPTVLPARIRAELRKIFFEDLATRSIAELRRRDPEALSRRVKQMVRLVCMSPDFQKR
ncbi:MAG: DUF1800 domain-containing protein [Bacteroidota bacterium]